MGTYRFAKKEKGLGLRTRAAYVTTHTLYWVRGSYNATHYLSYLHFYSTAMLSVRPIADPIMRIFRGTESANSFPGTLLPVVPRQPTLSGLHLPLSPYTDSLQKLALPQLLEEQRFDSIEAKNPLLDLSSFLYRSSLVHILDTLKISPCLG